MLPTHGTTDEFRWRARWWHATYAGHIPACLLITLLTSVTPRSRKVVGHSIVHETSTTERPYPHTHLAWLWDGTMNLQGANLMDILHDGQWIHPHVVHKKSLKWMQAVFQRYHHGYKTSDSGKTVYVAPTAGPWQMLPAEFDWNEYVISEVSEAPDLLIGVQMAGVTVRSVNDVLLLQNNKRPAPFDHNFPRESFLHIELPERYSCGVVGTLQIYGEINLGKSECALAQFENPCYVTEKNDLLQFRADMHDGIVIDKLVPKDVFSLKECEALTDFMQPATIKCLYKVARIPKRVRKIIVSNEQDIWPADSFGSQIVGRRVAQLKIRACPLQRQCAHGAMKKRGALV